MKRKMIKWLMGFLSVALIASNLTYVSAEVPDVSVSRTGSVTGSDSLQAGVSSVDKSITCNDESAPESDIPVHEKDVFVSRDTVPVTEIGTSTNGIEADMPENNASVSGNDALVIEIVTSVSENDVLFPENDVSVSGNDVGEMIVSLDSDQT